MKAIILNDAGHTEVLVETKEQLEALKTEHAKKWFFVDGEKMTLNEVTLDGIREVQIIEPLIGG
jgi:hypothetical protein